MIAIISANPAPQARAEPPSPSNRRKHASRLARPISCRGNIYRFQRMPAAMFIAPPTSCKCCAMSDPGWPVNGADDVRARGLPQFPVTFDPKIRLNFAAFCQASLPAGISRNARRDVAPARTMSDRVFGRQTP